MGEQPTVVAGPGPLVTTALIITTTVAVISLALAAGLVVRYPGGHGALTTSLTVFGVSGLGAILVACHRESRRRTTKGQRAILDAIAHSRSESLDEHRQLAATVQALGARIDELKPEGYNSDEYSHAYQDSRHDLATDLGERIDRLAAIVERLSGGSVTSLPGPRRSGR